MSLIDAREDDRAMLEAEDAAIAEAAHPRERPTTALDELEKLLSGEVHEAAEAGGRAGG